MPEVGGGHPPATATATVDATRGAELYALVESLYPLPRSITGDAVRETLRQAGQVAPLTVHEVPSGTRVFDWEVPPEWNLAGGWLETAAGERIVDVAGSNLHVVGYSAPVDRLLTLDELQPHLHSDPARPDVIPYRTSYYNRTWGFCLSHRQRLALRPGRYRARIDASLAPGSLTYGEAVIPGDTADEVIFYTHTCHPSLANDNLSGIAVCAHLARWLAGRRNRLGYRVIFGPGTIGSLAWLAANGDVLPRIRAGLVVVLVGDDGPLRYKRSWSGSTLVDRAAEAWFRQRGEGAPIVDFSPWGYDERQFCSPGFRLPIGRLTRSAEEGYPEYHSSADDLRLVTPGALAGALDACRELVEIIDGNERLTSTSPYGEPQLGRRGLYRNLGGPNGPALQRALLWVLSYADGNHDLIDVFSRSGLPYTSLREAVDLLREANLLS